MFVPGHLATAALAAVVVAHLQGRDGATPGPLRSVRRDAPRTARAGARHPVSVRWMLLPAALGALTPDLLDKSRMALGGSIYGRTIGHSLLFLVAITAVWVGWTRVRRWQGEDSAGPASATAASPGPGLSTAFGFWVLGVASHAVADLADDALRGLMRGGLVTSSWFAWPWATPYTHVFWVREPRLTSEWVARLDAWAGGTSPLEAVVLVAAGVWVLARVAGRRGAVGG